MTLSVSTAVVLRPDLNSRAQAILELTLLQAVLDPLVSDSRSGTSHHAELALSPILRECRPPHPPPPALPNLNHLQALTGDSPSQAVGGLGCV